MPDIDVKTVMGVDGDLPTRVGGVLDNITRANLAADPAFFRTGLSVKAAAYGAVGDGVADDTAAVRACMTAALAAATKVIFPPGDYLITDTLFDSSTMPRYSWSGIRQERGTNGTGLGGLDYSSSRIVFRPTDTTKPLIRCYSTTASLSTAIGPFEHVDLTFDLAGANGIVLGVDDPAAPTTFPAAPPTVVDGAGQRYVFAPTFRRCAFTATAADGASASEVITRSGRRMLSLTKAFETVIEQTSFYGGDTQVHSWGCDTLTLDKVRSQGSHVPFDLNGVGTFGAQHRVRDLQVESWTFTPLKAYACNFDGSGLRLEQNDGAPTGSGRLALSETFAVTKGSGALVASASMTGKLFPGLSLLELTSGTIVDTVMVTAVAGTAVTVDVSMTYLNYDAASATAVRIHGYGPLLTGGTLRGIGPGASTDCPWMVYWPVEDLGLHITGGTAPSGTFGDIRPLVLANMMAVNPGMHKWLTLHGVDPLLCPLNGHPFVKMDARANYGYSGQNASHRISNQPLSEAMATVRRVWAFTPWDGDGFNYAADGRSILVQVPDEANSLQNPWCWHHTVNTGYIALVDDTLPNSATSYVRIRLRAARDGSGSESLALTFYGNSGGSGPTVTLPATAGEFQTYEFVVPVPANWQGVRTSAGAVGIMVGGVGFYLQGLTVEELTTADQAYFPAGVGTRVKAGTPADADFAATPPDGTIVGDSTASKIWVRLGGAWKSVTVA